MKKILLILFLCLSTVINAQLPNGSVAPDWTLTDIDGTAHNLYTYLDGSYTVFIDFSAVWCGPCWGYHTSGALEDLYVNHGPIGFPNVNSNSTGDVMVFFIEGDANPISCLQGTGCSTQGDWVTGTPYPIICTDGTVNNDAVTSMYAISAWPTIYMICPDRTTTDVGQPTNPYGGITCSPAATLSNDPKVLNYSGATETCIGSLTPKVAIQNNGINPLTSLDVEVEVTSVGVIVWDSVITWTGNLQTYQSDNVILPTITGLSGFEFVTIIISNPNGTTDDDNANNITGFTVYVGTTLTTSITQNGSVLTANVFSGNPPYSYAWSSGETTQSITPTSGGSYSVIVTDNNGCVSDPTIFVFSTTNIENINKEIYIGLLNNKMYDLLGREFKNYNSIPKGSLYIKNRRKLIK